MTLDVRQILTHPLGCLECGTAETPSPSRGPVLLANPSFLLSHRLSPNTPILASNRERPATLADLHILRLWPNQAVPKGSVNCVPKGHPLTAKHEVYVWKALEDDTPIVLAEVQVELQWIDKLDDLVPTGEQSPSSKAASLRPRATIMSPAMRSGAGTPTTRTPSRTLSAAPVPLNFLKDDVPGPRLGRLLERLVLHKISEWDVMLGNRIPVKLLEAGCILEVTALRSAEGLSLAYGKITLETNLAIRSSKSETFEQETAAVDPILKQLEELVGMAAAPGVQRALLAGVKMKSRLRAAFGGYDQQVAALKQLVINPLRNPELYDRLRIHPPKGVLLYGPPGTGKTLLAGSISQSAKATTFVVNGAEFISEITGESEAVLRGVFETAKALQPSVIFFDELDAFAGVSNSSAKSRRGGAAGRLVSVLLSEMDKLQGNKVVVISGTNNLDSIDMSLRRPGRFDSELEMPPPSAKDRDTILQARLENVQHSLSRQLVQEIASKAHGYVGADLEALCNQAALSALRRFHEGRIDSASPVEMTKLTVTVGDMRDATRMVKPSSLREISLEIPHVRWEDIGGQHEIKRKIREAVELPFKDAARLQEFGGVAPKGILLYGPPGCSKTMLAQAVANEAGLGFLSVKGSELYNKYIGESEKAVAALFRRARASQPAVIFFDELDGLAVARGDGPSGNSVGDRVVSQLLQELDGIAGRQAVIVIGATNRLDCLDAALLRPGRFDRLIEVPLPDPETRTAILEVHTKRMPIYDDVDLSLLASLTEGYSGADIEHLCQRAGLHALENDINAKSISWRDFSVVLAEMED